MKKKVFYIVGIIAILSVVMLVTDRYGKVENNNFGVDDPTENIHSAFGLNFGYWTEEARKSMGCVFQEGGDVTLKPEGEAWAFLNRSPFTGIIHIENIPDRWDCVTSSPVKPYKIFDEYHFSLYKDSMMNSVSARGTSPTYIQCIQNAKEYVSLMEDEYQAGFKMVETTVGDNRWKATVWMLGDLKYDSGHTVADWSPTDNPITAATVEVWCVDGGLLDGQKISSHVSAYFHRWK